MNYQSTSIVMIGTLKNIAKISILEKVKDSEAKRQFKEDKWVIRSDPLYPNDLNMHLSDFGCLYQLLFK